MNDFPKVLVVDDGERRPDRALSADLAELGFASVTTSLEAADDVLRLISAPSAIFVQVPHRSPAIERRRFMELAARLKARETDTGIPVIVVDGSGLGHGGFASFARALSKPEH